MRVLIISRSKHRIQPEDLPRLAEAFTAWREKYRSISEYFEFFADGDGGIAVVDVEDEAELYQMVLEYPFGPTSDVELKPVVSGDKGMALFQGRVRAVMEMMAAMAR